ncbi:hypothetical protein LIER_01360 [Lithospermum erythrorhizon]|uniref:Uncharacterized protein n=1 Tax=Lithospermum erythrorhizon TaxID=34254 RepID=A0AAV3NM33_LITER
MTHLREHHHIDAGVKMRIPLDGETICNPLVDLPPMKRSCRHQLCPLPDRALRMGNLDSLSSWLSFRGGGSVAEFVQPDFQRVTHGGAASFPYLPQDEEYVIPRETGEGQSYSLAQTLVSRQRCFFRTGLSRGYVNFQGVDLDDLLRANKKKVVASHQVSYLDIISGNRLINEMLDFEAPSSSTQTPSAVPGESACNVGERLSTSLPTPMHVDQQAREFEILTILPFREKGFDNNHPFFVDLPYTFPSGVQIKKDSVPSTKTSLAADILKNCLLRPSTLGVLGTPPSSVFYRFSYRHLKTLETTYALSLRLSASSQQANEEVARLKADLVSMEKERDEALSKRDEVMTLCEKQRSDRERLLADAKEASEVYKNEGARLRQQIRNLQGQASRRARTFVTCSKVIQPLSLDLSVRGWRRTFLALPLTLMPLSLLECVVSLFDEFPEEEPVESDDSDSSSEDEDDEDDS